MKIPILVSIPHGGTEIPSEVFANVKLSKKALFDDSDSFTSQIYDVEDLVQHQLKATVARAVIDLNREEKDRPPENPDGVYKTKTCYGIEIYKTPLDNASSEQLIEKYYRPYHAQIEKRNQDEKTLLFLDCHSMLEFGPDLAQDKGEPRPLFCIGTNHGQACEQPVAEELATCISNSFNIEKDNIKIDDPFSGGFITRNYGENNKRWLQIEMNRSLYLSSKWFDPDNLRVKPERIEYLNQCFRKALNLYASNNFPPQKIT